MEALTYNIGDDAREEELLLVLVRGFLVMMLGLLRNRRSFGSEYHLVGGSIREEENFGRDDM